MQQINHKKIVMPNDSHKKADFCAILFRHLLIADSETSSE